MNGSLQALYNLLENYPHPVVLCKCSEEVNLMTHFRCSRGTPIATFYFCILFPDDRVIWSLFPRRFNFTKVFVNSKSVDQCDHIISD